MFEFKPLTSKDFPLLLEWLSKEHIKQWWNDGDDTLEKVALHYGENDNTARLLLIKTDTNQPIGYFQYYFAPDNCIGIDQFIGEEKYLNQGIGEQAIKLFINLIVQKHHPSNIILDPSPENKRAIRCYEKVGFKHYENEQNDTAYMIRLETKPSAIE